MTTISEQHPQPKEKKQGRSLLEHTMFIPGAIIAGGLLVIATGFGIYSFFASRNKQQKTKSSKLDS
jgi:hypothetical protein